MHGENLRSWLFEKHFVPPSYLPRLLFSFQSNFCLNAGHCGYCLARMFEDVPCWQAREQHTEGERQVCILHSWLDQLGTPNWALLQGMVNETLGSCYVLLCRMLSTIQHSACLVYVDGKTWGSFMVLSNESMCRRRDSHLIYMCGRGREMDFRPFLLHGVTELDT